MTRSRPAFVLEVVTDGNVMLGERLIRELRTELNQVDGVEVEFAPPQPPPRAAKSGHAIGDVALWVFLGTATNATARVLIEKISAWSQKERNRTVQITRGKDKIKISGNLDEAQERVIEKFLEGGCS